MLESLALDSLLILILLLLVPIGFYRGGLREVCSAAGVLLGLLVAQQWSPRWGSWVAGVTGIDEGISRFMVAMATLVLFAALIGYGAASAFTSSPSPGGRLYGGLVALASGFLFLGALIQFVASYLYDGVYPDMIRRGFVSRALSVGFDWVLLAVSVTVLVSIVLGMIVRERETDEILIEIPRDATSATRRPAPVPARAPEPVNLDPARAEASDVDPMAGTAVVKIREVRHWEEATPPTMRDLQSGWSRTWPGSVSADTATPAPRPGGVPRRARPASPDRPRAQSSEEDVIRDWLADDRSTNARRTHPNRPKDDT
ncbi:MAG: CvpA family protein [Chloroflexia bacterium]|nr:CvpA family protein [Chloroflexia bacterium]